MTLRRATTFIWMGLIGLCYLVAPRAIFSLFVSKEDPSSDAFLAAVTNFLGV